MGLSDKSQVSRLVDKLQNDRIGELQQTFKPPIYDIVKKFENASSGEIYKDFKPPIYPTLIAASI